MKASFVCVCKKDITNATRTLEKPYLTFSCSTYIIYMNICENVCVVSWCLILYKLSIPEITHCYNNVGIWCRCT